MTLTIYCVLIALASLIGGWLPLAQRLTHLRLQVYLSLSAGAMLGAAFFHMLPEAAELVGTRFGWWAAIGVLGLYVIERFVSPHSHEPSEPTAGHRQIGSGTEAHHPVCGSAREERAAAPRVAGWSAVVGLSIHTLLGGVALASAVLGESGNRDLGFAVFLATLLHKPADSLTISTLLIQAREGKRKAFWVQIFFATLIPLGALLFYAASSVIMDTLETSITGMVLAFSAGTFLCIALADLLPEVQFHRHDRVKLFLAVIAGALLMWATSLFEPVEAHRHGIESHAFAKLPACGFQDDAFPRPKWLWD